MSLFRIPETSHDAPARVTAKAAQAEQLGYTNVETHYHPGTDGHPGTHTVTGAAPTVPDSPGRYGH